jgi:hypothetical protein
MLNFAHQQGGLVCGEVEEPENVFVDFRFGGSD